MSERPSVVAFDVFGTTVDWYTGVTDHLREVFGRREVQTDPGAFAVAWRGRYGPALRDIGAGHRPWAPLDVLHREFLDALLYEHGADRHVDEADRNALVHAWHRLPAWPDSAELIDRLRRRYTVIALSNGGHPLLSSLAETGDLPFDRIVSAEPTRSYKPAPAPYLHAAELLGVEPGAMMLVAAHGWDLDGAAAVGMRTAFLERPGEYGPFDGAERAEDAPGGFAATSSDELAHRLGC
ncbi:haloacid dehalogenase type II [Nocardiopsis sp. HNM0947]|uniref:Haloacid dehalogenase type II n=1 Tax=Nocardiopsis coralli TaxID=2772213 RepID=A0ABR9PDX4_9ACTN|nr:haloacid dehalogenase type II [Nocardiopsis coralli]MBE3002053.1 haloacid dehalogenase type II [Nocardiopsis coralli]